MKKTITKEQAVTVHECDLCGKEIHDKRTCWVCQRDVCWQCGKLHFAGKHDDLIEFAITVCTTCGEREHVSHIRSAMNECNKRLRVLVEAWRKAVKR